MRSHPKFVLVLLTTACLASAVGAITFGPEVEVTDRIADAGEGRATHKAVASWNLHYYVVWTSSDALMLEIFDSDGLPVAERALLEGVSTFEALIVNDGSRLVVLWSDESSIRISPLSDDGELEIPGGRRLADSGYALDIAASAGNYLVVWRRGQSVQGVVLDRSLDGVASLDIDVTTYSMRVASNGHAFLFTWTGSYPSRGLFARTVDPDGTLGPEIVVDAEAGGAPPSVAGNGAGYIIGYAVEAGLSMAQVDENGVPSGTPVICWSHAYVTGSVLAPHPSGFLVVAEHWIPVGGIPEAPQPTRLYSFIVSSDGERLTDVNPVSTIDALSTNASLATNGEDFFATWMYSTGNYDGAVRGTVIRADGEVLFADEPVPGVTVSRSIRSQSDATVVRGSAGYLATWIDHVRERNEHSLRFGRLDRNGRSIAGSGIELHRSSDHPFPSMACGRSRCLIAYQVPTETAQINALLGRWVSLDGTSISSPFVITPYYLFGYSRFLVSDGENFATIAQSTLHIIRPDQRVLTTPIPRPDAWPWDEELASNGDGYVLFSSYGSQSVTIRTVGFDREGRVTGETTLLSPGRYEFDVASNGDEYLLVTDLLDGLRVSAFGTAVGGLFEIADGRDPAVTWNGSNWVVAWGLHDSYGRPTTLYVTTVRPFGVVLETRKVANGGPSRLAGSETGEAMVLFEAELEPGVWGSPVRLRARALDPRPEPVPGRRGVRRP